MVVLVVAFGTAGYLAFGEDINANITENIRGEGGAVSVAVSMVVSVCLVIAIYCSYPIQLYPVIEVGENMGLCNPDTRLVETKRNIFRVVVVVFTVLVALFVPKLGLVVSLVGGLGCANLAFVIPLLFYLKLFALTPRQLEFWVSVVIVVVGMVGVVATTGVAVLDIWTEL
eukprot:CAMPEP_0177679054 /NCGR_PEP_ID=MMETSP0447-20121125/29377_1 /TAXON_ID=0 /ORGANISM="Stygamoeba regulata, Strain BSH-02190019" /LENGTH=170 /DNA_ID=CAMNT_0019188177 /DNA_START=1 /DNA_END=509 /DNA_ORIENTATION=-